MQPATSAIALVSLPLSEGLTAMALARLVVRGIQAQEESTQPRGLGHLDQLTVHRLKQ